MSIAISGILFTSPPNVKSKFQEEILLWEPLESKARRLVAGNL